MWIHIIGKKHDVLIEWGSSYHARGRMTPPPPPPVEWCKLIIWKMGISSMGKKHDVLEVLGFSYHARGIMTPAFYYTSCSYKGCEFLSWVTNQIYWKYAWASTYHASGIMITAFYCTNFSYNVCQLLSWVTKIVIIQQGVILPWPW